jgi:hypothetical protein
MHADRTNRLAILLLALLCIAAGAAGGVASIGAFGTAIRHRPLVANRVAAFIGSQGDWLWPAAAAAAAILVLLAMRWLVALLFSTDRSGDLPISVDGSSAGRTTLAAGALTEAVVEEVESYRGVDSARGRLLGDPTDPQLVVTATLEETADFAALRQRIETGALTHARSALGNPALPIQLDLTVTTKRSARVA